MASPKARDGDSAAALSSVAAALSEALATADDDGDGRVDELEWEHHIVAESSEEAARILRAVFRRAAAKEPQRRAQQLEDAAAAVGHARGAASADGAVEVEGAAVSQDGSQSAGVPKGGQVDAHAATKQARPLGMPIESCLTLLATLSGGTLEQRATILFDTFAGESGSGERVVDRAGCGALVSALLSCSDASGVAISDAVVVISRQLGVLGGGDDGGGYGGADSDPTHYVLSLRQFLAVAHRFGQPLEDLMLVLRDLNSSDGHSSSDASFYDKELPGLFKAIAGDDGELTLDELKVVIPTHGLGHRALEGLFDLLDVSGDKRLSSDEFVGGLKQLFLGGAKSRLASAMRMYRLDGADRLQAALAPPSATTLAAAVNAVRSRLEGAGDTTGVAPKGVAELRDGSVRSNGMLKDFCCDLGCIGDTRGERLASVLLAGSDVSGLEVPQLLALVIAHIPKIEVAQMLLQDTSMEKKLVRYKSRAAAEARRSTLRVLRWVAYIGLIGSVTTTQMLFPWPGLLGPDFLTHFDTTASTLALSYVVSGMAALPFKFLAALIVKRLGVGGTWALMSGLEALVFVLDLLAIMTPSIPALMVGRAIFGVNGMIYSVTPLVVLTVFDRRSYGLAYSTADSIAGLGIVVAALWYTSLDTESGSFAAAIGIVHTIALISHIAVAVSVVLYRRLEADHGAARKSEGADGAGGESRLSLITRHIDMAARNRVSTLKSVTRLPEGVWLVALLYGFTWSMAFAYDGLSPLVFTARGDSREEAGQAVAASGVVMMIIAPIAAKFYMACGRRTASLAAGGLVLAGAHVLIGWTDVPSALVMALHGAMLGVIASMTYGSLVLVAPSGTEPVASAVATLGASLLNTVAAPAFASLPDTQEPDPAEPMLRFRPGEMLGTLHTAARFSCLLPLVILTHRLRTASLALFKSQQWRLASRSRSLRCGSACCPSATTSAWTRRRSPARSQPRALRVTSCSAQLTTTLMLQLPLDDAWCG